MNKAQKPRLVIWFSCGAASAVAAKICLAKYSGTHDIAIARCAVANEHPDSDRFCEDCERWFGQKIIRLASVEYKDCWDVWERRGFLRGVYGAPCTTHLKRAVRFQFEKDWSPDYQAYGYTAEELDRAEIFRRFNPSVSLLTPLIDDGLAKQDCLAIIENAGIQLPEMYRLGFTNNNCIGCVKGGMGYWNRIREIFPDVFTRMASLERKLAYAILRKNGKPLYLDELPKDAGRHTEPEIDCSMFCIRAEMYYALKVEGRPVVREEEQG